MDSLNYYKQRADRIQQSKNKREIERAKLVADIRKKAEISRKFINDKRHAEFRGLLEAAIEFKRNQYEALGESAQSNDEVIRRSLVLSTEIKVIKWILTTPHKFIAAEEKIEEGEKTQ